MKHILTLLFITGCTTADPNLIVTKTTVFMPDSQLFYCPTVDQMPDVSTLTDATVAELLITLDSYNHICAQSLSAVHQQLIDAQLRLETPA